jgi:hypothetical protein
VTEAARGRSVSEEIRRRLEWSLVHEWSNDQNTGVMIKAIASLAHNVRPYYGRWHEDPFAFAVFKIAIDALLTKVRPKGEPIPPADDGEFRPGDTPEEAGKALAMVEIVARGL